MRALSPWHIVLIAIVVLVLFGAGKLPGFARSLGQSLRIFKAETKAMKDDDADVPATPPAQIAAATQVPGAVPVTPTPVTAPTPTPEAPGSPPHTDH
ncbi:MAG: sec-independent protein translocase protein TatA [Frankiaceae bacterium]|jgi:sec-independent protein translocase protein TatA|nr:sec-independent protein translocase protein TatA [Frankiaceae bacterium]MDQ1714085.1 sec-independent protein translocase protein TatA [Frankiaceae bacterium]